MFHKQKNRTFFQVLITDDMIPEMIESFRHLTDPVEGIELPMTFEWPDQNFSIIVDKLVPDLPCCL